VVAAGWAVGWAAAAVGEAAEAGEPVVTDWAVAEAAAAQGEAGSAGAAARAAEDCAGRAADWVGPLGAARACHHTAPARSAALSAARAAEVAHTVGHTVAASASVLQHPAAPSTQPAATAPRTGAPGAWRAAARRAREAPRPARRSQAARRGVGTARRREGACDCAATQRQPRSLRPRARRRAWRSIKNAGRARHGSKVSWLQTEALRRRTARTARQGAAA
jgi:hypothetical protein